MHLSIPRGPIRRLASTQHCPLCAMEICCKNISGLGPLLLARRACSLKGFRDRVKQEDRRLDLPMVSAWKRMEAFSTEVAAVCLLWAFFVHACSWGTSGSTTFMELVHQALVECAGYLAVLPGRSFQECLLAEVRADLRSIIKTRACRQLVQRALARCGPAACFSRNFDRRSFNLSKPLQAALAASRCRKVKHTLRNKVPNLLVASRLAVALHMNQLAPLLGRNTLALLEIFHLHHRVQKHRWLRERGCCAGRSPLHTSSTTVPHQLESFAAMSPTNSVQCSE